MAGRLLVVAVTGGNVSRRDRRCRTQSKDVVYTCTCVYMYMWGSLGGGGGGGGYAGRPGWWGASLGSAQYYCKTNFIGTG